MKEFIKIPNLPKKNISSVLVDYRIDFQAKKFLNSLGICVYTTKRTETLYEAVAGHTDMVIHHLGGSKFVVSPENADFFKNIPEIEIIEGKTALKPKYPHDIAYNAARVGKFLIHNFKYTDRCILENSEELIKINVKQGYSKCSVCVVNENAIITSDLGIAKKCDNFNIDVLFVEDSDVVLNGISHGFFGGSTGLIAPDMLAVNGNIKYHKAHEQITEFCDKYHVKLITLHDGRIEDIGSIIGLTE